MLQRMNELAVQSSNGTNSQTDRKAIQDEIDQLTSEIDRVSETTKFNETYLLKGDATKTTNATFMKSGYALDGNTPLYIKGSTTALTSATLKEALAKGEKIYTQDKDGAQDDDHLAVKGEHYAYVTKLYDEDGKEVSAENVAAGKKADGKTDAGKYFTSSAAGTGVTNKTTLEVAKGTNANESASFTESTAVNGSISFSLHVGADSAEDNKIVVNIDSMSAAGIGVKGLKVDTEDDATAAIDRIAEAVQKVSSQRSTLGAVQNRLEHTIANLDNVVENTTSAESRIRDTDMAQEMVNYSKNNILAQAGQSMLAQANQSNQGVLSLLQ